MDAKAYAKINLTLEVLGRRADGYHEVKTVLQTIDLADKLHFTRAPRLEIQSSEPRLDGEDNLVWMAADALRRSTGCDDGARIRLEKHIPIGMGLGGGSSDAAATLKALNSLWRLNMGHEDLRSTGASLGADVPFFVEGGTALGEGRGTTITALPALQQSWIVLLCTSGYRDSGIPATPKTARLYSMLRPEHYTDGTHTRRLVDALRNGRFSQDRLFNVFERVAPSAFVGLGRAQQDFLGAGVDAVHLSGTGPALYGFVSSKEEGEGVVRSLKRKGLDAYCVSTI